MRIVIRVFPAGAFSTGPRLPPAKSYCAFMTWPRTARAPAASPGEQKSGAAARRAISSVRPNRRRPPLPPLHCMHRCADGQRSLNNPARGREPFVLPWRCLSCRRDRGTAPLVREGEGDVILRASIAAGAVPATASKLARLSARRPSRAVLAARLASASESERLSASVRWPSRDPRDQV
jgi:hypothetical protein